MWKLPSGIWSRWLPWLNVRQRALKQAHNNYLSEPNLTNNVGGGIQQSTQRSTGESGVSLLF